MALTCLFRFHLYLFLVNVCVAAANGHTDVVRLLCEHGARLSPNSSGNTAIRKSSLPRLLIYCVIQMHMLNMSDWAVQLGHVEVLKVVLGLPGASVMDKNTFGKSALSMVMDGTTSEPIASV